MEYGTLNKVVKLRSKIVPKKMVEFEDRFKEGKKVLNMQEVFDGVKVEMMRVFENFQVQHAIKMGGHYEMGPQKQKAKEAARLHGGAKDQFLYELSATYLHPSTEILFMGRIDTHDRMMGRFHHPVTSWFTYKLMGQTIDEHSAIIVEASLKPGNDVALSYKSVNFQQHTAAYMQTVLPTLAMGTKFDYNPKNGWIQSDFTLRYTPSYTFYNLFDGFPANYAGKTSLAVVEAFVLTVSTAKSKKIIGYSDESAGWSIPYSAYRNIGGFSMGYFKKVSKRVSFASFLKFVKLNPEKWDSSLKFGMEFLLPVCTYKAQINSNGTVSSFLEDSLGGAKITVAAKVNYFKSLYKFGMGITLQS